MSREEKDDVTATSLHILLPFLPPVEKVWRFNTCPVAHRQPHRRQKTKNSRRQKQRKTRQNERGEVKVAVRYTKRGGTKTDVN